MKIVIQQLLPNGQVSTVSLFAISRPANATRFSVQLQEQPAAQMSRVQLSEQMVQFLSKQMDMAPALGFEPVNNWVAEVLERLDSLGDPLLTMDIAVTLADSKLCSTRPNAR